MDHKATENRHMDSTTNDVAKRAMPTDRLAMPLDSEDELLDELVGRARPSRLANMS